MIADITRTVMAEEAASHQHVSQTYLQSLWAMGEILARHGFELPDPMFKLNPHRRTICLRYNGVVVQFSMGHNIGGYPTFLLISGAGRHRYFPAMPVDANSNDEAYATFVKRCIDELPKQSKSTIMKNSEHRWASINTDYRVQGNAHASRGAGL